MSPSTGARSGTVPSRPRAAGDGRVGATRLTCGHETQKAAVAVYPGGVKRYWCADCRSLKRRS